MEYRVPPVDPIESTLFGISADLGLGGTLLVDGGPAWTAQEDFDLERARFGRGRRVAAAASRNGYDTTGGGYSKRGWAIHFASFPRCAHNG